MNKTSIIPGILLLLLCCGFAHARSYFSSDDSTALQPIVSQSRRTRICAELCMSGLGGNPCGDRCYDLIPTNLPLSSTSQDNQGSQNINISVGSSEKYNATTRHDACDVLCKNKLGFPLCECNYEESSKMYDTDFVEVCSTFCINYNYQIYGCQNCTLYKLAAASSFDFANLDIEGGSGSTLTIKWSSWCRSVCSDGNGGAACNCDLLP